MKTSSRVKIRANRMNGLLSRGPITEEGKRRAAESNLSHGMYSTLDLLPNESREDFDALITKHVRKLRPGTSGELAAVRDLARISWRKRRIKLIRESMLRPESPELQPILDWQNSDHHDLASLDPRSAAAVRKLGILEYHDIELGGAYMRILQRILQGRMQNRDIPRSLPL
jgi:hypothetical protein